MSPISSRLARSMAAVLIAGIGFASGPSAADDRGGLRRKASRRHPTHRCRPRRARRIPRPFAASSRRNGHGVKEQLRQLERAAGGGTRSRPGGSTSWSREKRSSGGGPNSRDGGPTSPPEGHRYGGPPGQPGERQTDQGRLHEVAARCRPRGGRLRGSWPLLGRATARGSAAVQAGCSTDSRRTGASPSLSGPYRAHAGAARSSYFNLIVRERSGVTSQGRSGGRRAVLRDGLLRSS